MQTILKMHGITTLREAAERKDALRKHARGWGAKCAYELANYIEEATIHDQRDLLEDTDYRAFKFEDRLNSAWALLQDAQNTMLRAALRSQMSADTRRQVVAKLYDAAQYIEKLPVIGEKVNG